MNAMILSIYSSFAVYVIQVGQLFSPLSRLRAIILIAWSLVLIINLSPAGRWASVRYGTG
jgi:hypothetical protein